MQSHDALILVDVQKDFCTGGKLAVPDGDQIVPVLNQYMEEFKSAHLPVFVTRDWHPAETIHFNTGGGVWPPHCIQGTTGAEFHSDLALYKDVVIISSGTRPDEQGFSGFEGKDSQGKPLLDLLRQHDVDRLFVGGLATDYCVRSTVLDALRLGFRVVLIKDAIRGVDLKSGDSQRAIEEMIREGAEIKTSPPESH